MNWAAIADAVVDELAKIAEIDTSAISGETLQASQPQPMPSAAYEKAKHILDLAEQYQLPKTAAKKDYTDYIPVGRMLPKNWQPPKTHREFQDRLGAVIRRGKARTEPVGTQLQLPGMEKKSFLSRARQPDVLPQIKTILEEHREDEKRHRIGSAAGHVLGGAGAGKFLHDWADAGRQTLGKNPAPFNIKHRFGAMTAGGVLGAGVYAHKRLKARHAHKHKTSSVKVPPTTSQAPRLGLRGRLPDPFKK